MPQVVQNNRANKLRVKRKKRTALVICQNRSQFWTTQSQFWQWVRELKIVKINDNPLTGKFCLPNEESLVILGNAVLSLAHPNHLKEALSSRKLRKPK